ncbi:Crp/Fnr family transcriptional regulator [Taklimakanibacter deserti]|uniref:Crp/Fnr family transcriptional regulator n=1 Tax=Taklimakanibacter deserti TaxID=2267839 RepID=UPI000E65D1B3
MPRAALLAQSSALISRFRSLAPISETDINFLMGGLGPIERHPSGTELLREGEVIPGPHYILDGWALRTRYLSDGRRQIFGFVLPGDAIGLCERERPLALTSLIACTAIALCDASALRSVCLGLLPDFPHITRAHQRATALDEAYLLHQIIRIGRQTAYERLVHLFLELNSRCHAAGLSDGSTFEMPLTQEILADCLGLSIVHVNRTLQTLRREQLIEQKSPIVTIRDKERLVAIAEYADPQVAVSRWGN